MSVEFLSEILMLAKFLAKFCRCVRRPTDPAEDGGAAAAAGNWQCNAPSSAAAGPWPGQLASVAEGDPPVAGAGVERPWSPEGDDGHEALLMNKKKDAEIAALLRHIRLSSGLTRGIDPHHHQARTRPPPPAFNECLVERINFERSLGYYP